MWSLLGSLISNFLLLRDLFGYTIPGAVLLGSFYYFERPDLSRLPQTIHQSVWIKIVIFVTAAYVVGHVLAAIGYTLYDCKDWLAKRRAASKMPVTHLGHKKVEEEKERREEKRKSEIIDSLYFRYLYPSMFIEADRRETLTILRVTLSIALIAIVCLPDSPTILRIGSLVLGILLLFNGYFSLRKATEYAALGSKAGQRGQDNNIPVFRWSAGSPSNNAKADSLSQSASESTSES
jgi:hypothetical protein